MERERKKLAAVEMDALRRSCRVSRIERIRKEIIKEMMEIKGTILDDIHTIIKQIKIRKRGRPRKYRVGDIAKAMRDRGQEEEWTVDRKKWKRTVVDSSDRVL